LSHAVWPSFFVVVVICVDCACEYVSFFDQIQNIRNLAVQNYYRLIRVPNSSKFWIMISTSVSFVTLDSVARQQSCYITVILLDVKQVVLRALSTSPFKDYRVWWSLSDSKYAGTAMFIKKKFEPKKVSFNLDRTCMFGDDSMLS
jgi:hypothetical protein